MAKLWALGACLCLNAACGSSPPVDFYAPSSGPAGSANESGGSTATSSGGSAAGMPGGAGQATTGGGGSGNSSNAPCSPAKDITAGTNGTKNFALGTMGAACLRVNDMIAGWGCSNFDGRTLKVNRQTMMCGQVPLPDQVDGSYYFDISAGSFDYAAIYWF